MRVRFSSPLQMRNLSHFLTCLVSAKDSRSRLRLGAGGERVGRGLNLGNVLPPCRFVDGVLVRAAFSVDEFPDDVSVASVLGCFSNYPDKQDAEGRVPPVLGPVRHGPRCLQAERGYDAVGMGAGAPVKTDDVLARLIGAWPTCRRSARSSHPRSTKVAGEQMEADGATHRGSPRRGLADVEGVQHHENVA